MHVLHDAPPVDVTVVIFCHNQLPVTRRALQSALASIRQFVGPSSSSSSSSSPTAEALLVFYQTTNDNFIKSAVPNVVRKFRVPANEPLTHAMVRSAHEARGKVLLFLDDHHTMTADRVAVQWAATHSAESSTTAFLTAAPMWLGGTAQDPCAQSFAPDRMEWRDPNVPLSTVGVYRDTLLHRAPATWATMNVKWIDQPLSWNSMEAHDVLDFELDFPTQ